MLNRAENHEITERINKSSKNVFSMSTILTSVQALISQVPSFESEILRRINTLTDLAK